MTNRRFAHSCFRLGLLAAFLAAAFWGIWSLFAPIPDHGTLLVTENPAWTIPLHRLWDIPFAFLLVNVYGWVLRLAYLALNKFGGNDEDFGVGLVFGLGAGLIFGLVVGLGVGLGVGLAFGLGVGLKYVCSQTFWGNMYAFFAARDKA
mgnify:CR=1 FL=1